MLSSIAGRARSILRCASKRWYTVEITGKTRAELESKGEWLADVYPDIDLIRNRHDKITESLIQRIQVNNLEDADQMIDSLKEALEEYERCRDEHKAAVAMQEKDKEMSTQSSKSLQSFEAIQAVKNARYTLNNAYNTLIELYENMPNVISSSQQNYTPDSSTSKLMDLLSRIKAPCIQSYGKSASLHQDYVDLSYVVGDKAMLELEISDFTANFLETCDFLPVTCPSFMRYESLKQTGLATETLTDIYTLQTKGELHAAAASNSFREIAENRKVKFEDSHIFCVQGVCEAALMAFFVRCAYPSLPMQIYAIGSQYRMPHTGKSVQSKVANLVTASQSGDEAEKAYSYNIYLLEKYWKMLDVNITRRTVKPYELKQHEASAVELILNNTRNKQPQNAPLVLSRLSLTYDYISRRIMVYSDHKTPTQGFCHFTSANMIDINYLLDAVMR